MLNKIIGKKTIIVILLLAILAVVAVWALRFKQGRAPMANQSKQPTLGMKPLSPEQKPQLMPPDLPVESGAQVTQNFNYTQTGMEQGTTRYVTQKTEAQNTVIFQGYLTNAGWSNIAIQKPTSNLVIITASKTGPKLSIIITLSQNNVNKQDVVDITVTGQGPSVSK